MLWTSYAKIWYLRYGSSAQIATVGKGIQNDDSMYVSVLLTIAQSIKKCLMKYAVIRCNTDFTTPIMYKFLRNITAPHGEMTNLYCDL